MAAKKQNLVILQGETFERVIRWETLPYIYKAISAITQAGPVQITASSHGLVSGWRAAVVSARGMTEINAKYSPPRESEFKQVTRISDNSLTINDVNSSDFSVYTSGGYLQYFTPVALAGYSAKMFIRDRVGGTVLLTLGSDVLDDPDQRITIDGANNTISLVVAAVDTALLTWTKGVYDLEMTGPTGAVTRIFTGNVSVTKEVTV
jgi:hypothetical protein